MDKGNVPKIHPIVFLIALVLVSVFSTIIFKKFNVVTTSPNKATETQATSQMQVFYGGTSGDVVPMTVPSSSSVVVYENGKSAQSVLGCSNNGSCNFNSQTASQPVCISQGTSVNMANGGSQSGTTVTKNSVIQPYKITAPVALLSGSKYVSDSRLEIHGKFWTFRSAGDLITKEQFMSHSIPGVNTDDYSNIADNSVKGPFAVNTKVQKIGADNPSTGKAVISEKLASANANIQPGETNPDTTNKESEELYKALYGIPGQVVTSRDLGTSKCISVDSAGLELSGSENFQSCLSNVKPASFISKMFIDAERFLKCQKDNTGGCEKTELIGVQIDAIFGSSTKCASGNCASMLFDASMTAITPPGVAASLVPAEVDPSKISPTQPVIQPFYVTTPCEVLVDGSVVKTSCLWDVSPYKRIYEKERASKPPSDQDFPKTFEQYWAGVEAEAKARSVSCI